ncbi:MULTISPECIES: hydroxyacylglutathione hydrolase [Sphingobium]|uniref:Hydroxyacylglutathione hydrolase n=2 Tax=Sphingobium cupriresistens TaxID=1132417 RepID=A0A0J7XS80_9SPHN|nr:MULTISPECIES: hydroxyacylglutathione hydrolase [Sphingobium]KMS53913.1 hydroxyacylglutathione hydrolase [Sphingobium cupriresistens LL01]MBJ7377419.1 hydroxyacylglutathione hydrolase [Sphingobium sp.]RYM07433.1 hydroxyacylglutathione hydrolase [Sphingobium cupriresistens]WCP13382.1 Hydroxyacylglutathione hydrolase GloB [Sphingobium sp. AntQ-1]
MLEVVRIPVLTDNYVWLLHDAAGGETVAIDPAVAEPVLEAAAARGWTISQIWNTHWHGDHVGGNAAIKAAAKAWGGCMITGPAAEAEKIGTLDRTVDEGDTVRIGDHIATVMAVPAHTAGHIAYHLANDRVIFVGDTLFAMGCGRLFEGTAAQMFANMARLAKLPDETIVYCAHEYTLSNGRFALGVEPDNAALAQRVAAVEAARARGEATVPTSIGIERETNIFMRARDVAQLAERRAAKDAA